MNTIPSNDSGMISRFLSGSYLTTETGFRKMDGCKGIIRELGMTIGATVLGAFGSAAAIKATLILTGAALLAANPLVLAGALAFGAALVLTVIVAAKIFKFHENQHLHVKLQNKPTDSAAIPANSLDARLPLDSHNSGRDPEKTQSSVLVNDNPSEDKNFPAKIRVLNEILELFKVINKNDKEKIFIAVLSSSHEATTIALFLNRYVSSIDPFSAKGKSLEISEEEFNKIKNEVSSTNSTTS